MSVWAKLFTPTKSKRNDLGIAVRRGDLERVKKSLGADPRLISRKDEFGGTLLHEAASEGHLHVTEFLLGAKVDVGAKDNLGMTPLHWAARNGHREVLKLLLARGADVNAKDGVGMTALTLAVQRGQKDVTKLLIDNDGDVDGDLAVMLAREKQIQEQRREDRGGLIPLRTVRQAEIEELQAEKMRRLREWGLI